MLTPRKRKLLRWLGWGVALCVVLPVLLFVARMFYAFRDRQPGYELSLRLPQPPARPGTNGLRAGFARTPITPDLSDPRQPIWLAGFGHHRAATKIHDDLWAIACVLDDGRTRVGIVALDAIGFFHDDVIAVRRQLPQQWGLDYALVCSTHNHNTPDLLGLWGPDYLHTGVNPRYRRQVIAACVKTLGDAVARLEPARVAFHHLPVPTTGLVADTRRPHVFDPDLRVMHLLGASNQLTLGSIVTWSDHPETLWSRNTEVTADFCGALRETLEKGSPPEAPTPQAGLGGIHLYINGAIGGLISTTPEIAVQDPYLRQDFREPSHEKARALGRQLAARLLPSLTASPEAASSVAPLSVRAPHHRSGFGQPGLPRGGVPGPDRPRPLPLAPDSLRSRPGDLRRRRHRLRPRRTLPRAGQRWH